jgi:glycosyltransferase involved in cell wall biosynthesis
MNMRVLLVTHEASRTGAPRIALLVARSLIEQGCSVEVLSRAPGPLLPDFEATAPTFVEFFHRVRRKLWRMRGIRGVAYLVDTLLAAATLIRRRPDLIYVNSTSAAIYLRPARWLGGRVVLHVHESDMIAREFLTVARAPHQLNGITLVACSPSVQAELLELTDREVESIVLLPSIPDERTVLRRSMEPPDSSYAADDLVVGCCGTVEPRKGADLWVAIAREVRRALPERQVRFVWIGEIAQPVTTDDTAGVEFRGPSANPYPHLRRFDVATLPSRDDPFPLVVLEAMVLGTPVVAFAVGGVPEQIGDAGVLVTPGDATAFAREVVNLLTDHDRRHRLGTASRARVWELYSMSAFAAGLANVLGDASNRSPERAAVGSAGAQGHGPRPGPFGG